MMKNRLWLLPALLVLVFAACSPAETEGSEAAPAASPAAPTIEPATFDHYVRVQEALAADDFEAAKASVTELAASAEGVLRTRAEAAAAAGDIEALRREFKPLSDELLKHALPAGYASAYCPMADEGNGAYWAQREGDIANPYFGEMMLTCGSFQSPPAEANERIGG